MNTQEKVRSIIEGSTAQIMSMLMNTIGKGTFSDTVEETQRIVNDLGSQILQIVCTEADEIFNAERDRNNVIIKHAAKTRRLQSLTKPGERENVLAGLFYIENNFDEIDLTPATSCAAEGHVSHVLSARMSSRPMAWSRNGAHRIARLRAYYFNGGDFRDVVADRQHGVPQRRENTTEKYRRFNSETDGRKAANDYYSAHLIGIDGITNGLSATLRAILKRGNKKW